jgi:hypothetical protein
VEDNLKQFSFTNTGKYQVGYKFGIRSSATRELFTITPSDGSVEPGESVTIDLHFNKHKTLKQEAGPRHILPLLLLHLLLLLLHLHFHLLSSLHSLS